jgi:hypothetical protein
MALLNSAFDASGVEPAAPHELLPPGKYFAQIVRSEMQATKAGDGQMLWLELDVLDGPHRGRKLWDRLNLVNPSRQVVEIAQRQLSAICHAVGQLQVTDSEQLHFRRLLVTLAVEPDSRDKRLPPEQQRKQNWIKGYAPAGAQAATPQPTAVASAQSASVVAAPRPASSVGTTAPWRRAS